MKHFEPLEKYDCQMCSEKAAVLYGLKLNNGKMIWVCSKCFHKMLSMKYKNGERSQVKINNKIMNEEGTRTPEEKSS